MSFLLHTSGSVGAPGEQSPGATRPMPRKRYLAEQIVAFLEATASIQMHSSE